jgi:hypothetical protein
VIAHRQAVQKKQYDVKKKKKKKKKKGRND